MILSVRQVGAISQALSNISNKKQQLNRENINWWYYRFDRSEQYQRQAAIFKNSTQGEYQLRSTDDIIGQTGRSNISGRRNCRYHCSIRCAAHLREQLLIWCLCWERNLTFGPKSAPEVTYFRNNAAHLQEQILSISISILMNVLAAGPIWFLIVPNPHGP